VSWSAGALGSIRVCSFQPDPQVAAHFFGFGVYLQGAVAAFGAAVWFLLGKYNAVAASTAHLGGQQLFAEGG